MTDIHQPSFTFTIPSIHDGTDLECRIYNPPNSTFCTEDSHAAWRLRGAIIAHPYAPLGGCHDDPIVSCLVEEILKQEYIVGTFNFRLSGAGNSKGSTSWTAKAELNDYISFAGLFIHYLHSIRAHLDPKPGQTFPYHIPQPITLILGGYSYGSLLAIHLPPLPQILAPFSHPASGTAAAEIRLRAHHLSSPWRKELQAYQDTTTIRGRPSPSSYNLSPATIAIGGEESAPRSPRPSHESRRRSIDATIKRSVEKSRRRLGLRRQSNNSAETGSRDEVQEEALQAVVISELRTAYLLVSPLLPPLSSFLALSMGQRNGRVGEEKLVQAHTLVVYGNRDIFTSQRKLRRWAEGLKERVGSRFRFSEVQGAGHFWKEEGVEEEMKRAVGQWTRDLVFDSERC
ncbi:MAG: hypothetical protein Q9217_001990 [Psora testacea]